MYAGAALRLRTGLVASKTRLAGTAAMLSTGSAAHFSPLGTKDFLEPLEFLRRERFPDFAHHFPHEFLAGLTVAFRGGLELGPVFGQNIHDLLIFLRREVEFLNGTDNHSLFKGLTLHAFLKTSLDELAGLFEIFELGLLFGGQDAVQIGFKFLFLLFELLGDGFHGFPVCLSQSGEFLLLFRGKIQLFRQLFDDPVEHPKHEAVAMMRATGSRTHSRSSRSAGRVGRLAKSQSQGQDKNTYRNQQYPFHF